MNRKSAICSATLALIVLAGCVTPTAPTTSSPRLPTSVAAPPLPATLPTDFHPDCEAPFVAPPGEGVCVQWLGTGVHRELEPSLAVNPLDPDNVLVAWTVRGVAEKETDVDTGYVVASETTDAGRTWRTTIMRDPNLPEFRSATRYAFDERAAFAPDGTALVLYGGEMQRTAEVDDASRTTLATSKDGGQTWVYYRVTEDRAALYDYYGFAVAPDTGHMFVATNDIVTGALLLWASRDGGKTWSPPVTLSLSSTGPDGQSIHPSVVAGPHGLVVVVTRNVPRPDTGDPIPGVPAQGVNGQGARVSHDDGKTFGPLVLVAPDAQMKLITPNAALEPGSEPGSVHAILDDHQGVLLDATSIDGGSTWAPATPLGPLAGIAYWAMIACAPDGAVHALARSGTATTPWNIDWIRKAPNGTSATLHLAGDSRSSSEGRLGKLGPPNASDDYGGLAVAVDGKVWIAFSDPRGAENTRIAVVRLEQPSEP